MANKALELYRTRIVIPEGEDERRVIQTLCSLNNINDVQVLPRKKGGEGWTIFWDRMVSVAMAPDFDKVKKILLVTDNDNFPATRFEQIRKQITEANTKIGKVVYPVPDAVAVGKTAGGLPTVTIMMLPRKGKRGSFESLIWNAVKSTHTKKARRVVRFLRWMPTGGISVLTAKRQKARVSTYLSATCLRDPDCSVTDMWQGNMKNRELLDHAVFKPLIAMLRTF